MGRGPDRGLGIDWTFPAHVGQINSRGEDVIHEVGLRCPCNVEDTMAGQINHRGTRVPRRRTTFRCPRCDGSGYLYRNAKKIVALITNIAEDYQRTESGWGVPGDAIMSVKPDYRVSTGDLITFTWSQSLAEGQVIVRGAGTLSENSARKTQLEENEDLLHYNADKSIWCEDDDGKVYRGGSDFLLDGSKLIKWGSNRPRVGLAYTLKYTAFLEWEAQVPPSVRRDRNRDLGTRVMLRKRHIATPNEDPTIRQRDRVTFCSRLKGC